MLYKNFVGSARFNTADNTFYGKIENIDDLVNYKGKNKYEIKKEFHKAVDEYIEICKQSSKKIIKKNDNVEILDLQYFDVVNEDEPVGGGYPRSLSANQYFIKFSTWIVPGGPRRREFGFEIILHVDEAKKLNWFNKPSPWRVPLRRCTKLYLKTQMYDKTAMKFNERYHCLHLFLREIDEKSSIFDSGIIEIKESLYTGEYDFLKNGLYYCGDFRPKIITSMKLKNGTYLTRSNSEFKRIIYNLNTFRCFGERSLKAGYYVSCPEDNEFSKKQEKILEKNDISRVEMWSEVGGDQTEYYPNDDSIQTICDLICQQVEVDPVEEINN